MKDQERIFLEQVVPNDFQVSMLGGDDAGFLYGGMRRNVLALVLAEVGSNDGALSINIVQEHIPRFLLAEAIAEVERTAGGDAALERCRSIGLVYRGEGVFDFEMLQTPTGLPELLYREDVEAFRRSSAKVKQQDGLYVLPKAKSHTGKPVAAPAKRLIEAIAFEREVLGRLDAKRFGIYSAFCTWKDFVEGRERSREFYEDLLESQLNHEVQIYGADGFLELALKVQDRLLPKRIWSGETSLPSDAGDTLMAGMQSLNGFQTAQFDLMNGMHGGGLFVPLAQILGLNAWENYIEIKTAGLAPDSEDEQRIRSEVAMIRMLGDLGGNWATGLTELE